MPRFRLLILAFTLVAVTVPASHAVAAPTCALDGGTGTLAVTVSDQGPVVFTRHLDAVWLDGAPCDSATVTNTDLIHVVASTSTTIEVNLTGGGFAPGISVEEDSASEIEFFLESSNDDPLSVGVVGTDGSDHFVVGQTNVGMMGADVIDLDGVDVLADADIYSQGGTWNDVRLDGGQGADDLRGYLPRNAVEALPAYMEVAIYAGSGDDTVGWWAGGGSVDAGAGVDLLDQTGVLDDMVVELPASTMGIEGVGIPLNGIEHVVGGLDDDLIIGTSTGSHLRGGPGNDFLVGGPSADILEGDSGNDQVVGLDGDDDLDGGGNLEDVVLYSDASNGVIVDLGEGSRPARGTTPSKGSPACSAHRSRICSSVHQPTISSEVPVVTTSCAAGMGWMISTENEEATRSSGGMETMDSVVVPAMTRWTASGAKTFATVDVENTIGGSGVNTSTNFLGSFNEPLIDVLSASRSQGPSPSAHPL